MSEEKFDLIMRIITGVIGIVFAISFVALVEAVY